MGGSLSAGSPSSRTLSRRFALMLTAALAICVFVVSPAHALKGDANGDGQVNVQDARLVADYLVGNVLSIPRPADADVSGDEQITTADALLILQFAKGLRTTFDFQSPLVLTVLPAVGSTNVLLTANISVFFSEPISTNSLSGALTVKNAATGLAVLGRIERSQEGVIATFFPDQPLSPLTSYRIDVTTAVNDNEDNPLQQAFSGTFQTLALGTGILVSTNNLSAPINELAPQSVVFKALNSAGLPVRQVPVTFTARMGSGIFEPSKNRQITVLTNDAGVAQASFRLGGEAVLHTVEIAAVGFSTVPKFTALALPLPAVNLRIYSGNSQNGAPGTTAPFPLIVQATDAGGNSVAATPVTFAISQGQGSFGGQPTAVVPTNSSGTAQTLFTFGATSGTISVQASFPGMIGQAPDFSLLNLMPQPSSPTVITGRALDAQTLKPINHIYVYLVDNPTTWDWTDEFGAFSLTTTPGSHVVSVNGFESGPIGGNLYPVIAIPVNAVEGQVNDIGMPALLPQLDPQSYIDVSDTQGGTLTLRANTLWQMYVAPGQTRFANGTGTGRLYVASVPSDRIPMPVAGGKTSRFFDTIQPLNVVFDPPAQVSFPNSDNLPAGTVTDIFTLSYTSGTFVRTGRGQVSEDSRVVRSLPGEGITHGGWHNAPSPRPDPTTCLDGAVEDSEGKGIPACTVTYAGISSETDENGNYRFCNIPTNSPPAPIISCPVSDQCQVDTDNDGVCDEFERRHGSGGGGGGGGGGPPPENDPDKKPDIKLRIHPETLYLATGESAKVYVTVVVDEQPVAGELVQIDYDPPGSISGPTQVRTADTKVLEVIKQNPAAAGAVATIVFRNPGAVIAGALILGSLSVAERRFLEGRFLLDTNIIIRDVNECNEGPFTKAMVGLFITANKLRGNLFVSRTLLGEWSSRKVVSGTDCLTVPLFEEDKEAFLTARGITIIEDIPNPAVDAEIEAARIKFNTEGAAGTFGAGRFVPLDFEPNDLRMMTTAAQLQYRFVTNDDDILRLGNEKSIPTTVLPMNPCIPLFYPTKREGKFCGTNGAIP